MKMFNEAKEKLQNVHDSLLLDTEGDVNPNFVTELQTKINGCISMITDWEEESAPDEDDELSPEEELLESFELNETDF